MKELSCELGRNPKALSPDNTVHGTNMWPTWVLSAPDGPHVGPMNFAIRVIVQLLRIVLRILQRMHSEINTENLTHLYFTNALRQCKQIHCTHVIDDMPSPPKALKTATVPPMQFKKTAFIV